MQLSVQGALCSNSRDLTELNPDYMEDTHSATCLLCPSGGDLRVRGWGEERVKGSITNTLYIIKSEK